MSVLNKILIPPKSKEVDYYEIAKHELTWKLMAYTSIGVVLVTLGYLIFDQTAFWASLYGAITSNLIWYWFYKNRSYKVSGFVFVFHAILFLGGIMLLVPNALHVIEYMWLVVFALYAFFVFGKKTGYLLLGLSIVFFTVYLFYFLDDNIKNIEGKISGFQMLATLMNLVLGGFMTGILVTQFKATKTHADNKYKEINLDLIAKNGLIKAQDEEKTIMLREIHHRVKNNLQVVSSLIRLQSFETEDLGAKKIFDATVNRVVAMALIHEKMYQKDNLSKINLADYLSTLANDILGSTGNSKKVEFDIESELEIIGNRTVVPLALIFNELISNSLEHGFTTMVEGRISVKISMQDQGQFMIKYLDNGGWKENVKKSSFGLELIDTFVDQLDGVLERESSGQGTSYLIKLKNIE